MCRNCRKIAGKELSKKYCTYNSVRIYSYSLGTSDQSYLKYHVHKINKTEDQICHMSNESVEMGDHSFYDCMSAYRRRETHLRKTSLIFTEIR